MHQDCYGVVDIPDGDWLCWPCHVAEANEMVTGRPPSRPPRWLREAGDGSLYDPRQGRGLIVIDNLRTTTPPTLRSDHRRPRVVCTCEHSPWRCAVRVCTIWVRFGPSVCSQ